MKKTILIITLAILCGVAFATIEIVDVNDNPVDVNDPNSMANFNDVNDIYVSVVKVVRTRRISLVSLKRKYLRQIANADHEIARYQAIRTKIIAELAELNAVIAAAETKISDPNIKG